MKKQFLRLFVVLLFVVLLVLYFLLPAQVTVFRKVALQATQNGVGRLLTERDNWEKWWPSNKTAFQYDSLNFSPQQKMANIVVVGVPYSDSTLKGLLQSVYYKKDTSAALFQVSLPATANPFQRISNYFKGRKIALEADEILSRLQSYAQQPKNVYGMEIKLQKVKDSALVATRFQSDGYPDAKSIYEHVALLKDYINTEGATEKDVPMLHAETLNGKNYDVMVAIPVDRMLKGNGKIEPKRMVLGNILTGEVRGGIQTVQKGMNNLSFFVLDQHLSSPAIPYESLVTNRLQEPDTTKWITRLYYPIY